MNPNKQRIVIAELNGFKWSGLREEKDFIGWTLKGQYWPRLPDYLNDLNAINEVVASLSYTLRTAYTSVLFDICGSWSASVDATAAQRCQAYLRVMCKWENKP